MADRPVVPMPGADYFVTVPEDAEVVIDDTVTGHSIDFKRNAIMFTMSREMALDFGVVEPTEEERVARAARSAEFRRREAERQAQPGPALTLQSLLEHLGWSSAYAEHVLHPACSCDPLSEDPYLCSFAGDLGFTEVGGDRS